MGMTPRMTGRHLEGRCVLLRQSTLCPTTLNSKACITTLLWLIPKSCLPCGGDRVVSPRLLQSVLKLIEGFQVCFSPYATMLRMIIANGLMLGMRQVRAFSCEIGAKICPYAVNLPRGKEEFSFEATGTGASFKTCTQVFQNQGIPMW